MLAPRALTFIAVAIGGCSSQRADDAQRPFEVVVPTLVETLDPRFSTRSLDVKVTRLLHAGLFGLHPTTLEPVPLVAESWRGLGERRFEIRLRPGLRFHSGRPLSPADVCATIAALKDPELGSPHRTVVEAFGACKDTGRDTLVLELARPRATWLTDLELPILRADQARSAPAPDGRLDGLGPYRIASASDGEVALEPAAGGPLRAPARGVAVRTVRDENARAMRLLAGRADVAPNAISPALLPAIEARGLGVRSVPGANLTYLLMQNDRPPFDRLEVRRAIGQAIDRERLVRTLLAGRAVLANGVLPPGHWAADPELRTGGFDQEAARAVLARLEPVTLTTSTDRARLGIARAVAQMLGDAGLRVEVVSLDLGVLLGRLDRGDFELCSLQMPELTEPNVLRWFFHPRGVPGEGGEGRNRARWRSREAGELLDQASESANPATRRDLYRRFARLLLAEQPVVPLWHEDQVAVVSARAQSFLPSAEGRWMALTTAAPLPSGGGQR